MHPSIFSLATRGRKALITTVSALFLVATLLAPMAASAAVTCPVASGGAPQLLFNTVVSTNGQPNIAVNGIPGGCYQLQIFLAVKSASTTFPTGRVALQLNGDLNNNYGYQLWSDCANGVGQEYSLAQAYIPLGDIPNSAGNFSDPGVAAMMYTVIPDYYGNYFTHQVLTHDALEAAPSKPCVQNNSGRWNTGVTKQAITDMLFYTTDGSGFGTGTQLDVYIS